MTVSPIDDLRRSAAILWEEYRCHGPGELSPALLRPVEDAWRAIQATRPDLSPEIFRSAESIIDLSRRCVLRPEGLSFVTGEAGLIPRPDLHRRFDEALADLASTNLQGPPP